MAERKWSDGETVALLNAWRPLRHRRCQGIMDVWVPAKQRNRARRTRGLVTADWQAVATAVKNFRIVHNLHPSELRTHTHCQRKVERLREQFGEQQLATPGFVPVLYNNTAGRRGLHVLASAAVEVHGRGDCGGGGAGGQARGGVAVEVEDGGTATMPEVALGSASEDPPSGRVDGFTVAATDFLEAPIPKKRRTGASTSTSTGGGDSRAPSIKEEMVREVNAPAAAVAAEMVARLSEVIAAHSNDVTVVENVLKATSTLYTHVTAQRIELQKQMVAALTAAMGGAAVRVPAHA